MPRRATLVLSALAAIVATTASAAAGEIAPEIVPERAAVLERLVVQDCGSCHGLTLKGGLGPDLRAMTLAGAEPESLAAIILDGVPGTAMPPWRPLISEEDARWIAGYLLSRPE